MNGMGRRGPPGAVNGGPGFFKPRNNQPMNWRGSDRPGGNFRGSNNHDDRYPDTQFLTNIHTLPPNNGGSNFKTYSNSNFFPSFWNSRY